MTDGAFEKFNDTHVNLREYIERILDERERQHEISLAAARDAMKAAAGVLEKRLDHLNALRDDVVRDRSLYVTLNQYTAGHNALIDRFTEIEKWQNRTIGSNRVLVALAGIIGGAIGAAVVAFVKDFIK